MRPPQEKALPILSWLIIGLALIAAGTGLLWPGGSNHYNFTSLRGQTIAIWGGSGLYQFDSVAGASQEIAQDLVTLCVGIPLLIAATLMAARGSLYTRPIVAATFSPDGRYIATASADASVRQYIVDLGALLALAQERSHHVLTAEERAIYLGEPFPGGTP